MDPSSSTQQSGASLHPSEAALQAVERRLARSRELIVLGELIASIAHEFNNLLTPVSTYAQLALANPDDSALSRKALERAALGAQQAANISESILDLIRAGPRDSSSNIAVAAQNCLAEARHAAVEVSCSPDICVQVPSVVLVNILGNLFRNAVQAGARHIQLHVSVESSVACVSINDDGPGMATEKLNAVLGGFVSDRPGGCGLGLTLVQRLVQGYGGTLTVESTVGVGTTFHVKLPLSAHPGSTATSR